MVEGELMRYQKVHSKLWTDPQFRAWSRDARDAALYLLTCPHRNTEGLFRLPIPLAAYDLGWTVEATTAALDDLIDAGFIAVDTDTDLVWIPDALRWDPPVNANQVKGAVRVLAELPQSHLLEAYLAHASEVAPDLAEALVEALDWPTRSPFEAPSDDIESPSEAHPNPHSHSPSHSPSPSPSRPATAKGDTQDRSGPDPGGGGTGTPTAEEPTAADVADELLLRLGYVGDAASAGPDLIGYVDRALGRGWPPDDLLDAATEIGAMDPAEIDKTPRHVLLGAIRRRANKDPTVRTGDGRTIKPANPDRVDEILANVERARAGELR